MEAGDDEWSSVVTIVLVGFSVTSEDSVNSTSCCIPSDGVTKWFNSESRNFSERSWKWS